MKEREYLLLEAIVDDETATQAGLAANLDIAVGSVNWYIKRLIGRGYLKATRMDRTRLRYNLTAEGMRVLTQRATQYMKDSLSVYKQLRQDAVELLKEVEDKGITQVYLRDQDEAMDIMRLSCIENGITLEEQPSQWIIKHNGLSYRLSEHTPVKEKA